MGIEIVDTIPKLLEKVDVVFLESVDGRIHLQEAIPVIKAGKPLFIDKPAAGSLADVIAIFDLAKQNKVPCFSSSSLRFGAGLQELKRMSRLVKLQVQILGGLALIKKVHLIYSFTESMAWKLCTRLWVPDVKRLREPKLPMPILLQEFGRMEE